MSKWKLLLTILCGGCVLAASACNDEDVAISSTGISGVFSSESVVSGDEIEDSSFESTILESETEDSSLESISSERDSSVEPHTHTWECKVILSATCTERGILLKECVCGEEEYQEIRAGHKYNCETTISPTCEEKGEKTYSCTNGCGGSYTEEIPELGHDYDDGEVTIQPTCKSLGMKFHSKYVPLPRFLP